MIHQYRNNGYNIVLDVNSGAVHVVDELCYDVIAHLAAGEEPDEAALDRPETLEGLLAALKDRYKEEEIREAPGGCKGTDPGGKTLYQRCV